jgi:hypothetical protein
MMGIFLLACGFFVWATVIAANLLRRDESCQPETCDWCGQPALITGGNGRRLCIDCATGRKCDDPEKTLCWSKKAWAYLANEPRTGK